MVQDDQGDRPQLVHKQRIHPLSRLDRHLFHLRIKRRNQRNNDQAIADAHRFVTRNYRSGDQVILLAEPHHGDHVTKPMEILARHLHDGTTPSEPSKAQLGGGNNALGQEIPIHAVAVLGWCGSVESVILFQDELKSRFPPEIEHIICCGTMGFRYSCWSTLFDSDGSMISREISTYDVGFVHVCHIHTTKDVVYYKPQYLPNWERQQPAWTKVLDSPPSGILENLPLSAQPAGIYQQELSKYKYPDRFDGSDRLVWKSFRH
ncbi:unnamed protein product [Rhizoctonia solani]|uniref:Uncharacterized protein n=1 Tax=Rhizoctonia solani TaxID=456999 RepID=A0A8H3HD42_9AGAM|nr:unnamed protein product [Rhizoctonia solani]